MNHNQDLRDQAYIEGQEAVANNDGTCPYRSGQGVFTHWMNGVVDAVNSEEDIPEGTSDYLIGRCLGKLNISPLDRGYSAIGRAFSGYLAQKEVLT